MSVFTLVVVVLVVNTNEVKFLNFFEGVAKVSLFLRVLAVFLRELVVVVFLWAECATVVDKTRPNKLDRIGHWI